MTIHTITKAPTLVLGVGNILLRDEGIGVRIVEALGTRPLPAEIELFDGGTAGADLIDILANRQTVIVIDAAASDAEPGTLLKFSLEDLLPGQTASLSLHDLDIPQTLAMTRLLGCPPKTVVFFGIVPELIQPGLELSETLEKKVPILTETIFQEISRCGRDASKRNSETALTQR